MGAPVVHWELNSDNAERLQQFYTRLFDWKINANNPMHYGLVDTGSTLGAMGGIGQNDPNQPAPTVTFYVQVPDLQETLNQAVGLGGTIVMPPTEIPDMITMAMFRDPDGNIIGLVKGEEPKPVPKKTVRRTPAKKKAAPKRGKPARSRTKAKRRTTARRRR